MLTKESLVVFCCAANNLVFVIFLFLFEESVVFEFIIPVKSSADAKVFIFCEFKIGFETSCIVIVLISYFFTVVISSISLAIIVARGKGEVYFRTDIKL